MLVVCKVVWNRLKYAYFSSNLCLRDKGVYAKHPEFEKDLVKKIQQRHAMGLIRSRARVRRIGLKIARRHGLVNFKCSDGYLRKLAARNELDFLKRTTTRQQTVFCYIDSWNDWIHGIRSLAAEIGVVQNGYIKGNNVVNLDEFAIIGAARESKTKHLAPKDATMVNAQNILCKRSPYYRLCSVAGFFAMNGFDKGRSINFPLITGDISR